MAETNKKFTPEQIRAFEDKYNLGVNNREAIVELFMRQQEQIDEIAKNIHVEKIYGFECVRESLFDKLNNK